MSFFKSILTAGMLAGLLTAGAAHAEFPDRTVTLVVPFAAGGSTDVVARVIAERMSADLGQQVIVQNVAAQAAALARATWPGRSQMATPS